MDEFSSVAILPKNGATTGTGKTRGQVMGLIEMDMQCDSLTEKLQFCISSTALTVVILSNFLVKAEKEILKTYNSDI